MQNEIAALVPRGSGKKPLLSWSTCWKVLQVREGSYTILSECRFHVLVETSQLQACSGLRTSDSRGLLLLGKLPRDQGTEMAPEGVPTDV